MLRLRERRGLRGRSYNHKTRSAPSLFPVLTPRIVEPRVEDPPLHAPTPY